MRTLRELKTMVVRRHTGPLNGGLSICLLMSSTLVLAGALALRAQSSPPQATPVASVVDFTRDIQPILEKHCYECHGPSQGARPAAPPYRLHSFARAASPARRSRPGMATRACCFSGSWGWTPTIRCRSIAIRCRRRRSPCSRRGSIRARRCRPTGQHVDRRRREHRGTLGLCQAGASRRCRP